MEELGVEVTSIECKCQWHFSLCKPDNLFQPQKWNKIQSRYLDKMNQHYLFFLTLHLPLITLQVSFTPPNFS